MRAQKRKGFGWKRWSKRWLYAHLGLFNDYRVKYDRDITQSRSGTISLITLDTHAGEPSANLTAAFANGYWIMSYGSILRHSQRKRREMDRSNLRSIAPVLYPTCEGLGVKFPGLLDRELVSSLTDRLNFSYFSKPNLTRR